VGAPWAALAAAADGSLALPLGRSQPALTTGFASFAWKEWSSFRWLQSWIYFPGLLCIPGEEGVGVWFVAVRHFKLSIEVSFRSYHGGKKRDKAFRTLQTQKDSGRKTKKLNLGYTKKKWEGVMM